MQKIALALALTCAPTVCLAANDDALFNTLNAGLDAGINSLQAKLPLKFGPGMTVTAARRESRTITYTLDFQPSAVGGWRSSKVVDNLRASLTKRVCAENGRSWFDLGYVTQYSLWDRDTFIANVVVDTAACGY